MGLGVKTRLSAVGALFLLLCCASRASAAGIQVSYAITNGNHDGYEVRSGGSLDSVDLGNSVRFECETWRILCDAIPQQVYLGTDSTEEVLAALYFQNIR